MVACCRRPARPVDHFEQWVGQCAGKLSPQDNEYLAKHGIEYMLHGLLEVLLDQKPEKPTECLAEHFAAAAAQGTEEMFISKVSNFSAQMSSMSTDAPRVDLRRRLLVLTDIGEEIDDEAALWLLSTHLNSGSFWQADVVFATGNPEQRAMRWASILASCSREQRQSQRRIRYFLGPPSDRQMRYQVAASGPEMVKAGLGEAARYDGGMYDVVLQLSPLGGFSDNFSSPPSGPTGALARVGRRDLAPLPVYIVVGNEGSTNFPKDKLHVGFKAALRDKGFVDVHVESRNYVNWQPSFFGAMPHKLVQMVLADEWNKAVGRIPPVAATLFVRFRVNTLVNYDIVRRAFAYYEANYSSAPHFAAAEQWWQGIRAEVHQKIMEGYVAASRASDDGKSEGSRFGNPGVSSNVKGMDVSWKSVMSQKCIDDIAGSGAAEGELDALPVDSAMGSAVALMTGMLLRIFAFNAYGSGREPAESQYQAYLDSSLDFHAFPHLLGDLSGIQKQVVGSPMYDPSGMLVALIFMSATLDELQDMIGKLHEPKELLDSVNRTAALQAAYDGECFEVLAERFFPKVNRRLLVLSDGGEEADDEAALWLLARHLDTDACIDADVVFMTGNPLQRAMRWAGILNSLGKGAKPGTSRMRYFIGPESDRPMRYQIALDAAELKAAGLGDLARSFFDGGAYDVVLQISPLGGFSSDFSSFPDDARGALGRINPRADADVPLFIVAGAEGSDNFPADTMHARFKSLMIERGFTAVHIERPNYAYWEQACLGAMPQKLTDLVLEDEWNKTIRRIPPSSSTLLVRFRMNTLVKYDVVSRVFAAFKSRHGDSLYFKQADAWWKSIKHDVSRKILECYVQESRKADDADEEQFGNPCVTSRVRGKPFAWRSFLSPLLEEDLKQSGVDLDARRSPPMVDDVMGLSVTLMTGMLLRIYAFDMYLEQRTPNWLQIEVYLTGTGMTPPLDFQTFPSIFNDISAIKEIAVGSKMSDTTSMLITMVFLAADGDQFKELLRRLRKETPMLSRECLARTLLSALEGGAPSDLTEIVFSLHYV